MSPFAQLSSSKQSEEFDSTIRTNLQVMSDLWCLKVFFFFLSFLFARLFFNFFSQKLFVKSIFLMSCSLMT